MAKLPIIYKRKLINIFLKRSNYKFQKYKSFICIEKKISRKAIIKSQLIISCGSSNCRTFSGIYFTFTFLNMLLKRAKNFFLNSLFGYWFFSPNVQAFYFLYWCWNNHFKGIPLIFARTNKLVKKNLLVLINESSKTPICSFIVNRLQFKIVTLKLNMFMVTILNQDLCWLKFLWIFDLHKMFI